MIFVVAFIGAVSDFLQGKIPNWLLIIAGGYWCICCFELPNLMAGLIALGMLLIVRNCKQGAKSLGAGDVKILFVITLFLGGERSLYVMLFCFLVALLQVMLACLRDFKMPAKLRLGPAIFAGLLVEQILYSGGFYA